MDYRGTLAAIRSDRERKIERATVEARRKVAQAVADRDSEIRRLRADDPTRSYAAIASAVGCSAGTVQEVLRPDLKVAYNARRAQHWRRRHLKVASS
jgi:hypothetical protein